MNKSVVIPRIDQKMKDRIIKKQNNKCARKPYYHIDGLMNYNCKLWKKTTNKGKFINNNYVIIKIHNNKKNIESNLLALCDTCFHTLKNRYEKSKLKEIMEIMLVKSDTDESMTESESKSDIELEPISDEIYMVSNELDFDIDVVTLAELHLKPIQNLSTRKYQIINYPDIPGKINIRQSPSLTSEIIGTANYGDIFDGINTDDNLWIKIHHNNTFGFIKSMWNNRKLITELNKEPIQDTNCCVCYEQILHRIALVPCGHTTICDNCMTSWGKNTCPLCMQKFSSYIKIY